MRENINYRISSGSDASKTHDSRFVVVFCALLLFPIGYLSYLSSMIETLYTWSPVLALIICFFYLLYSRTQILIESASVAFFFLCLTLVLTSANSGSGSIVYALQLVCKYVSLFLVALLVAKDQNRECVCRALFFFFFILTLANTITVFLYPNAMYPDSRGWDICWLLGGDNFSVRYYILAVIFATLSGGRCSKKFLIVSLINYATFVFIRACGMGIVSFLIIAVFAFSPLRRMVVGKLKMWHAVVIGIAAFFVIVVLGQMEFFSIIIDALGKDATLSSRTKIWAQTFKLLSDHLAFGYGALRGPDVEQLLMLPGMTNVHNTYLMLAMFGGIVLVGLFLLFQVCCSRSFDRIPNSYATNFLVVCCIALALHAQIEGNYIELTIFVFSLAFYLGSGQKLKAEIKTT